MKLAHIAANLNRRQCTHLHDLDLIKSLMNSNDEYIAKRTKLRQEEKAIFDKNTFKFGQRPSEEQLLKLKDFKSRSSVVEKQYKTNYAKLNELIMALPNDISEHTLDKEKILYEDDISELPLAIQHEEYGTINNLIDFKTAAKVSGNSFYYLKNKAVFLQQGLINYALKFYNNKGFDVMTTPDIVNSTINTACGFQPRQTSKNEYHLSNNKVLCATAEIPLAGYHSETTTTFKGKDEPLFKDHILVKELGYPCMHVGLGKAYRAETGSYNAMSRGLYRVHEFSKVELFIVCLPLHSNELFEYLLSCQKEFFKSLGLYIKVIEMPASDLGSSAYRKVDIEAYFRGRQTFGELSSTSHCTTFQSKRLNICYRRDGKLKLFHTLNGTGCAVQRTMACGLEQWQKNGKVILPKVLQDEVGFESL